MPSLSLYVKNRSIIYYDLILSQIVFDCNILIKKISNYIIIKEHSENVGFKIISEDSYTENSLKGYKIIFKQMDLIYVSYLVESNNTVYEIEYPVSESNYNSIKSDLEKTVNSFKIN